MTHDQAADWLLETRRYIKSDPWYVASLLKDVDEPQLGLSKRMIENIAVGVKYIQVDPEVLEAYLYNAAFELRLKG